MSGKLTRAQRRTLEWFAAQVAPVHLFSQQGPTLNMRRWGVRQGLLATGKAGMWVSYEITPAGRAALSTPQGERP
jgi:hypothetical protein